MRERIAFSPCLHQAKEDNFPTLSMGKRERFNLAVCAEHFEITML